MCYPLDEDIPRDVAALVEPLAVARRAVHRSHAAVLRRVMVVGCGSIGLLCLMTARQLGIADLVAVDISPSRRSAATRAGATRVLPQIPELPPADGPWALIDCTGSADVTKGLVQAAPPQSRITLVGVTPGEIPMPIKEILDKELELVGSLSHDASDFETAIRLLADSSFDAGWLITKRMALDDVPSLMKASADHQEEDELKVLVAPSERHE
jgi:threonine dehydrogenase-like Zn-dependent dehydrogenase